MMDEACSVVFRLLFGAYCMPQKATNDGIPHHQLNRLLKVCCYLRAPVLPRNQLQPVKLRCALSVFCVGSRETWRGRIRWHLAHQSQTEHDPVVLAVLMTLTIELRPELEARLRAEAAKVGSDLHTFIVQALEEHLGRHNRSSMPSHLSLQETDLLQKIDQGLPEVIWKEYHDLIGKRRAETLTPEEHVRLITLADSIAEAHTERMVHVAKLARLQDRPLKTLMKQLDIKPRKV